MRTLRAIFDKEFICLLFAIFATIRMMYTVVMYDYASWIAAAIIAFATIFIATEPKYKGEDRVG